MFVSSKVPCQLLYIGMSEQSIYHDEVTVCTAPIESINNCSTFKCFIFCNVETEVVCLVALLTLINRKEP